MKKLLSLLLCVFMCLSLIGTVSAAIEPEISISVEKSVVEVKAAGLAPNTPISLQGFHQSWQDEEQRDYLGQFVTDASGAVTITYSSTRTFVGGDVIRVLIGGGGLTNPLEAIYEIEGGTFDIVAEVLEWGTAVTAVIIDVGEEITQEEVIEMDFSVHARTVMPRNGNVIYNGPRTIEKAYVSAANEKGEPAESGNYIVLELRYGYNATNPQVDGSAAINYVSRNHFLNLEYTVAMDGAKLAQQSLIRPIYDDFELVSNPVAGFTGQSYRMYTPADSDGKALPLIIFNHGAGETYEANAGGNEGSQLFANMGGVGWVKNAPEAAYVLVPQRGTGAGAPGYSRPGIIAFVNDLIEQGKVDADRVYVSGASAGGAETHNYLREYPEVFAAAIPICPAGTLTLDQVRPFVHIPVWYVHANTDRSTPPSTSEVPYNHLLSLNAKDARRTNFPTVDGRSVFGTELPNPYYTNADGVPFEFYPDGHWSWVMLLNNEFVNDGGIGGNHPGSTPTEDATMFMDWLFAQVRYVPEVFTVTFMLDGEVYGVEDVTEGDKVTRPYDDPEKEGYIFLGWFDGDVEFDFDIPVTSDITLSAKFEKIPVTSFRINAAIIETVARGWTYNFGVIVNEGAVAENVIWTLSNPALGFVDDDGKVTIFERTGTVVLLATETSSGLSNSIMLRIAS